MFKDCQPVRMQASPTHLPRVVLAIVFSLVALCANVATAYAQSASCGRLQSALEQLNRNNDFETLGRNDQLARDLAGQVQDAESAYVRNGCNDDAKAGRVLTPQCQGIAREVLRLREDYAQVAGAVETGSAVAQQREAILQEMARFGCGTDPGSSAVFSQERQNLFDRIFGSNSGNYQDGQVIENDDYWGWGNYQTVRTVCVRLSDGYFWPVSYATLPDYVGNDAAQCQQMCPGTPVELYFYDNPGQEPENMRNMYGQPYTSLPNAFAYRERYDESSTCKEPVVSGKITLAEAGDGSRPMVEYGDRRFPFPVRDPRRQAEVAVAELDPAEFVDVPLPRPRPAGPGEAPEAQAVEDDTDLRLVKFGERVVRVVGPMTPFAQAGAAGS